MVQQKQAGNVAALVLLGLLVIVVAGLAGWRVWNSMQVASTNNTVANGAADQPLSGGNTDADLASDLSNLSASVDQESTNANSANSVLNDSQNQITVPTE